MVLTSLDKIVRRTLQKSRVPLHYYIQYLTFANDILRELQFSMLPAAKTVKLTLDANNEADLPVDYVEEIGLYRAVGDKLVQMQHGDDISSFDGAPFPEEAEVYVPYSIDFSWVQNIEQDSAYNTKLFGHTPTTTNKYRIVRDLAKVRVDNNSDLTEVYLKYITLPEKVTNQTLVHPMAETAISTGLMWLRAFYWKENDVMMKRQEFYNERRKLKAALNPLNATDLINAMRRTHNQAVKT